MVDNDNPKETPAEQHQDAEGNPKPKDQDPLITLSDHIGALVREIRTDREADTGEHGKDRNWQRTIAWLSLIASFATLAVLVKTCQVYNAINTTEVGQATIMATQAVTMDKQRGIADQQSTHLKRQLDDFEAVEAAAISIQKFSIKGIQHARIEFELVNSGPTEATEIQLINGGAGGPIGPIRGPIGPGEYEGIGIGPSKAGFSMAAGERRSFAFEADFFPPLPKEIKIPPIVRRFRPAPERIKRGLQAFYLEIAVAYRDKFGKAHSTSDCLAYNPKSRRYEPCFGGHFMR